MKIKSFFNSHGKQIAILITITIMVVVALKYEIDTKMVVFGTVLLGVFTQAFAGVAALIATLPLIGPLIVKIFTIPIFWILNSSAFRLFIPHKANFSFYERCYISQIRYNCCSNLSV